MGSGILLTAAITYFVLPLGLNDPDMTENANKRRAVDLLKVPSICVAMLSLLVASSSIGFLWSGLEPHMRQFDLSPPMMGKRKSEWVKQGEQIKDLSYCHCRCHVCVERRNVRPNRSDIWIHLRPLSIKPHANQLLRCHLHHRRLLLPRARPIPRPPHPHAGLCCHPRPP